MAVPFPDHALILSFSTEGSMGGRMIARWLGMEIIVGAAHDKMAYNDR